MAGCTFLSTSGSSQTKVSTEITVYEPGSDFAEAAPEFTEPPRVEFEPNTNQVVIVGTLVVGSSQCDRAVVETAEYNRDEDTLRLIVGSGTAQHAGDECTGDQSVDPYRVIVTFEDEYPGTVVATEVGSEGRRSTTANHKASSD